MCYLAGVERTLILFFVTLVIGSVPVHGQTGLSPVQIFQAAAPSVVRVETDLGVGTGFIFMHYTLPVLATARHVVEGAHRVRVIFNSGQSFNVYVYTSDNARDIAILHVDPAGPRLPFSGLLLRSEPSQAGERIYVTGYPLGMSEMAITEGLISASYSNGFQFSAPISSGNSGSPVIDNRGEVVGLVTAGSTTRGAPVLQNMNWAVPAAWLENLDDRTGQFGMLHDISEERTNESRKPHAQTGKDN
jgi:S1-C subfamily serine protease